jgi:pyruvate-formate lyase
MEQLEKTWNNRTKHEATEQNMEQLDKRWNNWTKQYTLMRKAVIYIYVCEQGQTIYVKQVVCTIFYPAKFEQKITHLHVLLRWASLIDGTDATLILCLHDLITHHVHIFNNFWIC